MDDTNSNGGSNDGLPHGIYDIIYYGPITELSSHMAKADPESAVVPLRGLWPYKAYGLWRTTFEAEVVTLRTFNAPHGHSAGDVRKRIEKEKHQYTDNEEERPSYCATNYSALQVGQPQQASWDSTALVELFGKTPTPLFLPDYILRDRNARVSLGEVCTLCRRIFDASKGLNHPSSHGGEFDFCRLPMFSHHLREIFDFHPSASCLLKSAMEGCHFCTLICYRLSPEWALVERKPHALPSTVPQLVIDWTRWCARTGDFGDSQDPQTLQTCRRMSLTFEQTEIVLLDPTEFLKRPLDPTRYLQALPDPNNMHYFDTWTGSDAIIALARTWIDDCVSSHRQSCGFGGDPYYRPTRLLDVCEWNGSQEVRLDIRGKGHIATKVTYLSLSHCWGPEHLVKYKLTKDTLDDLQRGIPLSKLSQTFQDAVTVCRKLGQRYIWIDSLCIIQDSSTDWEYEAAQMHCVYSNSHCTIAAVCAQNSSEGFLKRRNPRVKHIFKLPTKDAALIPGSDWPMYHTPTARPLFQRAWAIQERILSPRLLKFEKDRILWQCEREEHLEQTFLPFANVSDPVSRQRFREVCAHGTEIDNHEFHEDNDDSEQQRQINAERWWLDFVRDYSRMGLTKASDRLPALSGILSSLSSGRGWEFFDGLPLHCFLMSLLWRCKEGRRLKQNTETIELGKCMVTTSVVNTLSWASVESPGSGTYCSYWDRWFSGTMNTLPRISRSESSSVLTYQRQQCVKLLKVEEVPEPSMQTSFDDSEKSYYYELHKHTYCAQLLELKLSSPGDRKASQAILRGSIIDIETRCIQVIPSSESTDSEESEWIWSHPHRKQYKPRIHDHPGWFKPDIGELCAGPSHAGLSMQVTCLIIVEWESDIKCNGIPDLAAGVVLIKSPQDGTYSRIGYFELGDTSCNQPPCEPTRQMMRTETLTIL